MVASRGLVGSRVLIARLWLWCLFCSWLPSCWAQEPPLSGTVTDPSGAVIVGAEVQLQGHGLTLHQKTGHDGRYRFRTLRRGQYDLHVSSAGFQPATQITIHEAEPQTVDVRLAIATRKDSVEVQDGTNGVGLDEANNASTIVIDHRRMNALSDDPDRLAEQLRELTPTGAEVVVDGFRNLPVPPKSEIEEIKIVSNSYPPENPFPGGASIEITTKGGSDEFHGSGSFDYNNQSFDTRNPFFTGPELPSFSNQSIYANLSGPIRKQKAWWVFNYARRAQDKTALVNAEMLNSDLDEIAVNQGVPVPRLRPHIEPRVDYQIKPGNLLSVLFLHGSDNTNNVGAGGYSLASHGYSFLYRYDQFRASDSAQLSPHLLTSNSFLIMRGPMDMRDNESNPAIIVPGAFEGGGAQMGDSHQVNTWSEINSLTSFSKGHHVLKWGASLDTTEIRDASYANFGGTYTFQGGTGPQLIGSLQPVPCTSIPLTALDVYQRTLRLQAAGIGAATIRALGGGAYQFTLNAGTPNVDLDEAGLGLFAGDEWRVRPTVSFNYGFRYERQNDIPRGANWAPRLGFAWAPMRLGKTVIRGGMGAFYTDIPSDTVLNSLLFNGKTQRSYSVFNPDFFPSIPTSGQLASDQSPQQLQLLSPHLERGQLWQASVALEREVNKYVRLSAGYAERRGVHLELTRNINAPLPGTYSGPGTGTYPFGDDLVRLSTESTGLSRTHELSVTSSIVFKNFTMSGSYLLSYGMTDAEPEMYPSDPYNIRLDWGPSTFDDVRHRLMLFGTIPLPMKFTLGEFFTMSSGDPYNITTGLDLNRNASLTARPALLAGVTAAGCSGAYLQYEPDFGCFRLDPTPNAQIERNSGRGPWQTFLSDLSLERSWNLKPGKGTPRKAEASGDDDDAVPTSGSSTVGLGIEAQNPFNQTVYAAPEGDLSSPYFGQSRSSVSGRGVWGREITLKLQFSF